MKNTHAAARSSPTQPLVMLDHSFRASVLGRRTVPPITIAAAMITRFLMMYCPSSVGAHGKRVQV
jgi:hypothetical protein